MNPTESRAVAVAAIEAAERQDGPGDKTQRATAKALIYIGDVLAAKTEPAKAPAKAKATAKTEPEPPADPPAE